MTGIGEKDKLYLTIPEICYYGFWIIMLWAKGTGLYEGMWQYKLCLTIAGGFIVLKLLTDSYSQLEIIGIVIILILGGVIYFRSGEQAPLIYICMVVGLKNISIMRVFKIGLIVWMYSFLYRGILALTGISKGFVLVHEKLGLGPIVRWSFGYPHPNVLHISYAVLAAFILFLFRGKAKKLYKVLAILFAGNCLVFLYSVSFTGFLLTSVCLLAFLYFEKRKKIQKFEKIFIQCILPFCIIFSVILPLGIGLKGPIYNLALLLNDILNSRFMASWVYITDGITLFGKNFVGSPIKFALDSSYVILLVKYGFILFVLILVGYFFTIRNLIKKDKRKELAIVVSFLIAGISEPFLFNSSFKNISLLFVGEFLFAVSYSYKLKVPGSILNNEGSLLGRNKKRICISIEIFNEVWRRICRMVSEKRKVLCIGGILFALAGASTYLYNMNIPEGIYVGIGNTDCEKREIVYLDMENLPFDFDGIIYEYQGPEYGMYRFDGTTIWLEILRNTIGWGMLSILAGEIFFMILLYVLDKSKKGVQNNK